MEKQGADSTEHSKLPKEMQAVLKTLFGQQIFTEMSWVCMCCVQACCLEKQEESPFPCAVAGRGPGLLLTHGKSPWSTTLPPFL